MSKVIKIGSVSIPLESYVISGTALLGTKGAGKTYLGKGIAEQLLEHSIPIVVFDPIGRWRFMKLAGNDAAKPRGYKIVVAGGEQPDLPLTASSAPEIVRAAIRENIPLVLDLYDRKLSKADWRRIVQSCFRTLLYENKGLRHVFLEETAEFAPQKVFDGETYAEVEKLVRMGGNASVGITLINQRAQEVNKAVLDLCDNLVLMRQRGSHAIGALEKWIDRLDPNQAKEIAASMPRMKAGEAWVFAGSAENAERVETAAIKSFHPDRSRPQAVAGAKAVDPADFVAKLSGELSKLIDESKANDPKALRARIAQLERGASVIVPMPASELLAAEKRGEAAGFALGWNKAVERAEQCYGRMRGAIVNALRDNLGLAEANAPVSAQRAPPAMPRAPSAPQTIPIGEAAILRACIQYPNGLERGQLTVLTGYKRSSRDAYIARLAARGFVTTGARITASEEGLRALPDAEPLPTGRALRDFWLSRLPEGERKILEILIEAKPDPVARADLDGPTGYKRTSRDAYLARLAAKELVIAAGPGMVLASDQLFRL